jgi:hypothetical protein
VFAELVVLGLMTHAAAWEPGQEGSFPVERAAAEIVDLKAPALFPPIVDASLPENIDAPQSVLTIMREMWTASPSFRRQCARIARATDGRIAFEIRKPRSAEFQAASVIERKGRTWRARVEVPLDTKIVELIAHELEHIIEHIDAVDLPRLSRQGIDGVIEGADHFETARAIAAGKRVAKEYANRGKQAS